MGTKRMENIPRIGQQRQVNASSPRKVQINDIKYKIHFSALRKCGRKLPRYCDANNDKKITLTEWLNCLQTPKLDVNAMSAPQSDIKQQHISSTSKWPKKINNYIQIC